MSKRAYWIVRAEGAKDDIDHFLYFTRKEAYDHADRMVMFGWCARAYVERCYRQTYAVVK